MNAGKTTFPMSGYEIEIGRDGTVILTAHYLSHPSQDRQKPHTLTLAIVPRKAAELGQTLLLAATGLGPPNDSATPTPRR